MAHIQFSKGDVTLTVEIDEDAEPAVVDRWLGVFNDNVALLVLPRPTADLKPAHSHVITGTHVQNVTYEDFAERLRREAHRAG